MVPFDSSITLLGDYDRQPGLLWHQAALEHAMARPPNNRIVSTSEPDGEQREDANNCARDEEQRGFDAYLPSPHSETPATYSRASVSKH